MSTHRSLHQSAGLLHPVQSNIEALTTQSGRPLAKTPSCLAIHHREAKMSQVLPAGGDPDVLSSDNE